MVSPRNFRHPKWILKHQRLNLPKNEEHDALVNTAFYSKGLLQKQIGFLPKRVLWKQLKML